MRLECIPDYQNAEAWAAYAAEHGMGFEYNEFFQPDVLDDAAKVKEIVGIYRALGRDTKGDTLHGAFLDITVGSSDSMIRKASDYRVRQSIEIGSELGVKGIVFHTNYLAGFKSKAYRDRWVDKSIVYYDRLCNAYPDIEIYLENMFDESPELLSWVAAGMQHVKNFGVCLDIAHAFLSDAPETEWLTALSGYIKHIHLNDNDGLEDLHLPVGSGKIDWSILKNPELLVLNPSVLIEVTGMDKTEQSLRYITANALL